MYLSKKYSPPYSVVLMVGSEFGSVPDSIKGKLIESTNDCIAIACRSEYDGETSFLIGEGWDIDPGFDYSFKGWLDTPNKIMLLKTVLGEILLKVPVKSEQTELCIWVNDSREPDEIRVGIMQYNLQNEFEYE